MNTLLCAKFKREARHLIALLALIGAIDNQVRASACDVRGKQLDYPLIHWQFAANEAFMQAK